MGLFTVVSIETPPEELPVEFRVTDIAVSVANSNIRISDIQYFLSQVIS